MNRAYKTTAYDPRSISMAAFSKNKILKTCIYIFLYSSVSMAVINTNAEPAEDAVNVATENEPDSASIDESVPTAHQQEAVEEEVIYHNPNNRIIKEIIIDGNIHVPTDAILDRIPYRVGEP